MENLKKFLSFGRIEEASVNWDEVFETSFSSIYNYFIYHTADTLTAEDLTAECFERAWRARARYSSRKAKPSTWLFGFARNLLKEHYRKYRKQKSLPLDETLDLKAESLGLEATAQLLQRNQSLRAAIMALPEREREIVSLKFGAGLRNTEIAQVMNLSETNVGTLLQRTLTKLKVSKEDYDE